MHESKWRVRLRNPVHNFGARVSIHIELCDKHHIRPDTDPSSLLGSFLHPVERNEEVHTCTAGGF